MNNELFRGSLVRLTAFDIEKDSKEMEIWSRDSFYLRLLDAAAGGPFNTRMIVESLEKHDQDPYLFAIRTLPDDRLIGEIGFGGIDWAARNAWVGIGIGVKEYWGHGYGTEAMRLMLRFGFAELNLHRVSLDVFDYNARAIRSYQKAGFTIEGRERKALRRSGERFDIVYMGILRSEWETLPPC